MRRQRITVLVEIDLDPVTGWGDNPDDMVNMIRGQLDNTVPHYDPKVRIFDLDASRRVHALLVVHGVADGTVRIQGRVLDGAE